MPGPYHDFLLLSHVEHRVSDYADFFNHPSAIPLEDALLRDLSDSLEWIPTFNPARNERHRGLCFYGPTVIQIDGAPAAARIFDAWANLLACGPPILNLRGGWILADGVALDEGEYERVHFERSEVCRKLRKIAEFASQVVEKSGDRFILHLGI